MKATTSSPTKLHIFVNRRKLELATNSLSGAELLKAAGFEGQDWDLLLLQGEGDPSGGEVILADRELILKEGEHFRVLPGNRTFGSID